MGDYKGNLGIAFYLAIQMQGTHFNCIPAVGSFFIPPTSFFKKIFRKLSPNYICVVFIFCSASVYSSLGRIKMLSGQSASDLKILLVHS